MRLLIIDNDYPNEDNLYGDVFVHVRIKKYKANHECLVLSLTSKNDYTYEGVNVKACRDTSHANLLIDEYKPDLIIIHFVLKGMIDDIISCHTKPFLIWVHGYEALGWYRRLFNLNWKYYLSPLFLSMVKNNTRQMLSLRKLIRYSNNNSRIGFVFVSRWMRRICETDTFTKASRSWVLANPIDTDFFNCSGKNPELRKHILLIRPFTTRKYATDIAINAILLLSKELFFNELKFTIVGKGQYFESYTRPLVEFSNVALVNTFITQKEIRKYHQRHGVFLCPTRQDAQGVSMCEAMSSGLVAISSNNTAIPEFVTDNVSGYLTNNAAEIASRIKYLYHHPDRFLRMSGAAAAAMKEKCSISNIVQQELAIIEAQSAVNS